MHAAFRMASRIFGRAGKSEDPRDFFLQQMPAHSVCAEIGVYKGDFSERILRIVQPTRFHLIDPWRFDPAPTYKESLYGGERGQNQESMDLIHAGVLERFREPIGSGVVQVHRSASAEAAATFADEYFDWVYIDGDHQYDFVMEDLKAYFPKVKHGGFVTGDDYGEGGWWKGGVKKAVDEFAAAAPVDSLTTRRRQFWFRRK